MRSLKNSNKKILNFISEAGMLKRVQRSGWWVVGIKNPETVAEHSFRCAVLGYVLAKMERVKPYKVLVMTIFGDIHEARINDLHKMVQRYVDSDQAEQKAFTEQVESLPADIKDELVDLRKEYNRQSTKAAVISRDADILECLIQAKEYHEQGFKDAHKFMQKAPNFLKTRSAKQLWKMTKNMQLNEWWERLSNFKR